MEDLERLYRERYFGFRAALATVTGSYDTARDAVHEGFARALANRHQFKGGSLAAWVWRIAYNAALESRKAREVPGEVEPQLVEEGDPAPESIKEELRRQGDHPPLRVGHRVIERPKPPPPDLVNARLAVALDSSVGAVYLWAAPTSGGGACTALEITALPPMPNGRPYIGVNCQPAPTTERPIDVRRAQVAVGGGLEYVQGQVHPSIVRLQVALSDKRVIPVRLVDGFFLAELPSGVTAVEYRGFDARGSLVDRLRVPSILPPPRRSRAIEPYREAASIRLYSGREARIEQARGEGGTLCWRVVWGPQAGGCNPLPGHALPSMMVSGSGENQLVLLHGPVGSRIARIDLIWDNGDRERLPIQNGFVLKQIDPNGTRFPSRIVGRDHAGRIVRERAAFGPG